jgi:hypothetical protein
MHLNLIKNFFEPIFEDFSLRRRAKEKHFFSTSARQFHHQNHLALKEATTCVVATFWSFLIIISMTGKVEK